MPVILVANHGACNYESWHQDPAAHISIAEIGEGGNYCPINYQHRFKTWLQTTQTIILHWLCLVVKHGHYDADGYKDDQEDDAYYYVEEMNPLEALDWLVQVVDTVIAPEDWYEALIEWQEKYPVQEQ